MEKKTLYVITLEPIEQRYTKQWYNYFKEAFSEKFEVKYINGKIRSDKIDKGKFLDINKTNLWKAEQVIELGWLFSEDKIKEGDSFFFADGWHFGITALKYMSQLNNIPVKIFSYWHAGTYDEHDFISQAGLGYWAGNNEVGWMLACDMNFVATKYHKELILKEHGNFLKDRISVVDFPMLWEQEFVNQLGYTKRPKKEELVVFPHRLDPEKQPAVFDTIKREFLGDVRFVKTLDVTTDKKDYYQLIRKAKIVFSANLQETYGIGTVESVLMGAIPIVPNRLAYVEMYPKDFRYDTIEEAITKIKYYLENYDNPKVKTQLKNLKQKLKNKSMYSIKEIMEIMLK